jgi:hypothetical protein
MVPFQEVKQDRAQRIFELVVLPDRNIIDLLGNVERVNL